MKELIIKSNDYCNIFIYSSDKLLKKRYVFPNEKIRYLLDESNVYYLKVYSSKNINYGIPIYLNTDIFINLDFHNYRSIKVILLEKNYKIKVMKGEIFLWQNNIK